MTLEPMQKKVEERKACNPALQLNYYPGSDGVCSKRSDKSINQYAFPISEDVYLAACIPVDLSHNQWQLDREPQTPANMT